MKHVDSQKPTTGHSVGNAATVGDATPAGVAQGDAWMPTFDHPGSNAATDGDAKLLGDNVQSALLGSGIARQELVAIDQAVRRNVRYQDPIDNMLKRPSALTVEHIASLQWERDSLAKATVLLRAKRAQVLEQLARPAGRYVPVLQHDAGSRR